MAALRMVGRLLAHLATTIAKTVGGMSGAQTFGQDNATTAAKLRDDYRP